MKMETCFVTPPPPLSEEKEKKIAQSPPPHSRGPVVGPLENGEVDIINQPQQD